MKKKVVKIIFRSKVYDVLFDYKVKLECGHYTWLWSFRGDPMDSLQSCSGCKIPELKVI